MTEQTGMLVPKSRFTEFKDAGEWVESSIGTICKSFSGGTPSTTQKEYYGGEIPFIRSAEIDKEKTELFLTKEGLKNSSAKEVKRGDVLVALYGANSGDVAISKMNGAINQAILCLSSNLSNQFIYQFLLFRKNWIVKKYIQGGQGNLSGEIVKSLDILLPKPEEQHKIAGCLSSIDELITAQTNKIAALKDHKKGLMQQLFPAEGETTPKLRFPEFQDAGDWKEKTLDECLDYQQPIPYLVSDTNYSDAFKTPVLTAGKTFILGYTNEQNGIFSDNLPVIIFDDFTTATQFVDFPFKAKSSAMKILLEKSGANIKFMYELMQMVAYEVGTHERHWISKFAPMTVLIPSPDEQKKIADCLSSIDDLINAQTQKLESYKIHKKGLMQQLFPNTVEVVE